jgi:hypothetical protein
MDDDHPNRDGRRVGKAVVRGWRLDASGGVGVAGHELRRGVESLLEATATQRHEKRQRPSGDRRVQERVNRVGGPKKGARSCQQFHVAGAGGAEQVTRQHEREAQQAAEDRRPHPDAAEAGCGDADADGRKRRGQQIGNAAGAKVDHGRGAHADGNDRDHQRVR